MTSTETLDLDLDLDLAPSLDLDTYDGATWGYNVWQDDATQLASLRTFADHDDHVSTDDLDAAQTWQEVLTLPADPTQRLPRMIAGDPGPRTNVPLRERPGRGQVRITSADGTVTIVAPDGSPITPKGTSTKRANAARRAAITRKLNQHVQAVARGEVLANIDAGPVAPAPCLENGEVVGYFNEDGSIG